MGQECRGGVVSELESQGSDKEIERRGQLSI